MVKMRSRPELRCLVVRSYRLCCHDSVVQLRLALPARPPLYAPRVPRGMAGTPDDMAETPPGFPFAWTHSLTSCAWCAFPAEYFSSQTSARLGAYVRRLNRKIVDRV